MKTIRNYSKKMTTRFLLSFALILNSFDVYSASTPTGIITDIFEIQLDALDEATNKALGSLTERIKVSVKNSMDNNQIDVTPQDTDLKNTKLLQNTVDAVYGDLGNISGLTDALGKVSKGISIKEDINKIENLSKIPSAILDIVKNADEISENIAKLIQNDKKGVILRNIREYGSGMSNGKVTALLQDIDSENYKALYDIATSLTNVDEKSQGLARQVFDLVFKASQINIADELSKQLQTEAGIKKYIQDQVVSTWLSNGPPGLETNHDLLAQHAYNLIKHEGIINFFDSYELMKESGYASIYDGSLAGEDTFSYDFRYGSKVAIEVNSEESTIYGAGTEENKPIESHQVVNPDSPREKNNQLITKSIDIKEEENVLLKKQKELDDAKAKLANTDKYINNYSENTQTSYDPTKLAYLQTAKNLVDKYGNKPRTEWPVSDQIKLKTLAENLGIDKFFLVDQLLQGNFNSLRDKFASTSSTSTSVETIENLDYKNIEGQISALTNDIRTLNQGLTLDKMQQADLKMSVNNLNNAINDVNNGNKVRVTESNSTPPHENWWQGYYTKNYYSENNSGEPVINGWGDGPARTQASKPGIGTVLYLDNVGDPQGINREITLKNSASEYFGDYNYVAWGTWSDPKAVNGTYISHWVVVNQLDRGQVPHTGSASYKGELNGVLFNMGQANTIHNANGDITMTADFAKNNINGNLSVRNADNGADFAKAAFNTGMSSTADGDGLKFQGALTGAGISNKQEFPSQISGEFGGNQAAEAGGTWSVTKGTGSVGDGRATGVFRAEKQ